MPLPKDFLIPGEVSIEVTAPTSAPNPLELELELLYANPGTGKKPRKPKGGIKVMPGAKGVMTFEIEEGEVLEMKCLTVGTCTVRVQQDATSREVEVGTSQPVTLGVTGVRFKTF